MAVIQNRMRTLRALVLLCGALAFLLFVVGAGAQQQPSPPPPPPPAAEAPAQEKPVGGIKPPMAKPTPADDDDAGEIIRVTSNLVVVPVSVTDAAGQPVLGLTAAEFRLEEEGKAQEIAQIGDPEQVPLDIAILLDVSGSVDAQFTFEKEAAARFLKQVLKTGDRATLFAIDQKPRLEQARDTAERVADKLLTIAPAKSATAFYDTVNEASKYLARNTPPQNRRVIVVISDGEDNFSNRTRDVEVAMYRALNKETEGQTDKQRREQLVKLRNDAQQQALLEVQRELQRAEVVFYSINPSGEALRLNLPGVRAQEGMARLAEATGGNTFVPESQNVKLTDLDKVFSQIAAELRSQYLLQYYSSDESSTNKFLRIKVAVPTRPQLRIRARQGYYPKHK
jgi:Ca-activated chloride channel family protein